MMGAARFRGEYRTLRLSRPMSPERDRPVSADGKSAEIWPAPKERPRLQPGRQPHCRPTAKITLHQHVLGGGFGRRGSRGGD
jgi:hypothetical protein